MKYSILFLSLVCTYAYGQRSTPTPDEKRIRENRLASNAAIAAHDTSAIARYWATDILVLTSRNSQNVGKNRNAEAFANEFKVKQNVIYIRTPDRVEVSSLGNMASEAGHWVGEWTDGNERIKVTGTYYGKWLKSGDDWVIRAEVYTALTCEGERYCKTLVAK